ncbi:MAG: hypothetical protein ACJ8B6_13495 [Gemmatimonadales bacterium]
MRIRVIRRASLFRLALLLALAPVLGPARVRAQDLPPVGGDTLFTKPLVNTTAGEFTPSTGFRIFEAGLASLNISVYGLFRYLDQTPGEQTYTDHLGNERAVKARNDINWHRTMVWFTGHFFTQRFRYNITAWSLGSTQQTLLFGNLQYFVGPLLRIGVGMAPNLTVRSLQGSFPYWAGSDRQMTEEYMRAGFSSGLWITGQPFKKFYYTASVNTNLSQLGVTAANDPRGMAYSASVQWLPTTGEFGPRGGFGDLEHHTELATRFGASVAHAREGRAAPDSAPNNETQLRLSDGVYVFSEGALAPGVVVRDLDYDEFAIDAGLKYRGLSLQGEYYVRSLGDFNTSGPVPEASITDHGFQVQAMYMVIPKLVGVYGTYGRVFDHFDRNPWEVSGGVSFWPAGIRSWRINAHLIRVEKSPTGSNFGYYTAGQSGTTFSLGTDVIF